MMSSLLVDNAKFAAFTSTWRENGSARQSIRFQTEVSLASGRRRRRRRRRRRKTRDRKIRRRRVSTTAVVNWG